MFLALAIECGIGQLFQQDMCFAIEHAIAPLDTPAAQQWLICSAFQLLRQFVQPSFCAVRFDVLERLIVYPPVARRAAALATDLPATL